MPRVKATEKFEHIIDGAIGRPRQTGEEWEVDQERADHLVKHGVAVIVDEVVLEKPKRSAKKKS